MHLVNTGNLKKEHIIELTSGLISRLGLFHVEFVTRCTYDFLSSFMAVTCNITWPGLNQDQILRASKKLTAGRIRDEIIRAAYAT